MSGAFRQITLTSDPEKSYFLRVDWSGDLGAGFTLVLSDGGSSAWIGEVSEDEVATEITDMGIDRDRYVEDLRAALTGCRAGRGGLAQREEAGYSFHLTPDRSRLSYRKVCKDISFNLGSVELQAVPDPVEVSRQMIGQSLRRNADLEAENGTLREENARLQREHQRIVREMQQRVEQKESMESSLYSRFVLVLNEKKAKIRALQDSVQRLQHDGQDATDTDRHSDGEMTEVGSTASSQESTLLITGRSLSCVGETIADTEDVDKSPKRKRRVRRAQGPETSELE